MKKKFIKAIANSSLVRGFVAKPMPKWVVYLADILIVAFSCVITLTFGIHNDNGSEWIYSPAARAMFEFLIYGILSFVLGTSRYIIRLSVIEDTYKLVLLVGVASVVLSLVSFATYFSLGFAYFNFWNVFVIGVMSFTLMLLMRLTIKYIYIQLAGVAQHKTRVIVLGSAINSFSLRRL